MNTRSHIPHAEKHPDTVARILERAGAIAILPGLTAVILFLVSGQLDWTWAWVYVGLNLANLFIVAPTAMRTNPETVAERGELQMTEQSCDIRSVFFLLIMYIALPLVAGLNLRFDWARDLGIAWHLAGAAVLAVGLGLTTWAMLTNAYMWSEARIQSGQTVCSTGPYRFVRHPAYLGVVLEALGVPFLLGSWWALIPGIMAAVLMIIATSSEDRMLQAELPGYRDYVQKVRYRLVPGVW